MRMFRLGALVAATLIAFSLIVWASSAKLPDYVVYREMVVNDRSTKVLIVELPTSFWNWNVVSDPGNPKTVQAWREELGADLVFNAAYFNKDFTPSGYFKEGKGASTVPWPTAQAQAERFGYTFLVQPQVGGFTLAYLPDAPQEEPATNAFLSFPTLLANGLPMVQENSFLYAARTVLAEDAEGRDYLVITEKGSVTLYDMAQWLAKQPEQFVLAGNLDGGPSTGLSLEHGRKSIELPSALVPSVIAGYRSE